ncbi:enoyl-CoA hydratase/isomerase family protein [Leekyejoonella antrihumi]|uniref:enoyl-CoA hydratase n=1 Tax=Leekyejoonella antrihumi TaxID=1660198 RepID=A0A563E2M7_9MICO|nr:enoyl-CoA hydratase-related protein [Leekyejoonella antrihumi]TWP36549.1 enoyl-CoA hydratase/isomerase family protein [Leekyejoonella antrihumi]
MSEYGEYVSLEAQDGVGVIRIDRPKMNPLDKGIQEGLAQAAIDAGADDSIAAVIVYGGERVFAAGADIKEMESLGYTDMVGRATRLQECFAAVSNIPKPTVAAIAGYALGGGCELAMTCDFRIAASDAKLGQPEILLGIIPGAGGTQRLARLVGPAKAKDIIFTGRFVDAQEALEIGLVDELAEPGHVLEAARAKMAPFVDGPAYALRAAKTAIDRGLEVDLHTGLAIESMQFAGLFATRDREIGMKSFIKNGPGKAAFEGR